LHPAEFSVKGAPPGVVFLFSLFEGLQEAAGYVMLLTVMFA